MGNAYCSNCCRQKMEVGILSTELQAEDDYPSHKFAKSVKQMIQISPKTRDIYLRKRIPHIPERKGTKLHFHYLFDLAAYYDGDWKSGLPHGYGRLIYDDGSMYQGCFNMGQAQCKKALFIRSDGSFYKGQVKDNKANGEGQMIHPKSSQKVTYIGKWKNDLPHGQGRQVFGAGNANYDGDFVQGKKHGKGIYHWNMKEYYSGDFYNNKMEGQGEYHTKDYTYKGEFRNNKKHGQGILQNHTKCWKYTGEFYEGKMQGQGMFQWQDGTKFIGRFQNNARTEQGKLQMVNGKVLTNPRISVTESKFRSSSQILDKVRANTINLQEDQQQISNL